MMAIMYMQCTAYMSCRCNRLYVIHDGAFKKLHVLLLIIVLNNQNNGDINTILELHEYIVWN